MTNEDPALLAALHGDHDTAERILRTERPQDDPRVMFNLGWHEVRHGRLSAGMRLMDAGRYINCYGLPALPGRIWRDEPLDGKTLLFRQEGGYGDQILNFRFARDFAARGARVVMSCAPDLQPIFNRHGFVTCDNGHAHGLFYDYWVPAMSAVHVLGYEHETLKGAAYLSALPRQPLYAKQKTLKVGIRWAGNPEFEHQQHRIFPPEPLIDLHNIRGVTLYSLQRDDNLIDGLPFADLRASLTDWEATASIIADLDLVISSCTSTAHLAAALGVETWIIVPILPYMPWATPGESTPWYDSVRLFRQTTFGEWGAPLDAVRSALVERVSLRKVA
jgi:hypothetical protein